VPFGQLIAFLDEAAQRWDLFPVDLNVVAGDAPEMVSIRGVLQQTTQGN
jgi:type II secretory pathway component PulM